jgi:hypothetical protein
MPTIKLTGKLIAPDTDEYVGGKGEIFFDPHGEVEHLRRSDGATPGGQILSGGSGGGDGNDLTVQNTFTDGDELVLANGAKVSITQLPGYLQQGDPALTTADVLSANIWPGGMSGNGTLTISAAPDGAVGVEMGSDGNPFRPDLYMFTCVYGTGTGEDAAAWFYVIGMNNNADVGEALVTANSPAQFWIHGVDQAQITVTMGSTPFATNDSFLVDFSHATGVGSDRFARVPGNFATTVNNLFGLSNCVNYWKFNEKPSADGSAVIIKDYGPNAQDFQLEPTSGCVLGAISAINDGNTGLQMSSNLTLPFNPQQWGGLKNYQTILLAVNFNHCYDFVQLSAFDGAHNLGFQLRIYSGGECSFVLGNTDGGEFMRLEFPYRFIGAGKALIGFTWGYNDMGFFVNNEAVTATIASANGTFIGMPSTNAEGSYLELAGGEDSPIVSHLLFTNRPVTTNEWKILLNAAGVGDPIGAPQPPVPMAHATSSVFADFFLNNSTDLRNYWHFDGSWGQVALDAVSNNHLRADGMTTLGWNIGGIINDGTTGMSLNGTMVSSFATTEVWSAVDFTIGLAIDTGRTTTPSAVYTLHGADITAAADVNKAELRIDETEISATLFNEGGTAYAVVSFGDSWIIGPGRYFIVVQYDSSNNRLILWVNGYDTFIDTTDGNGTIVSQFPLNNSAPTMSLNANGAIIHSMFYCANCLPREQMSALMAASGMGFGVFRPRGITGQYDTGAGASFSIQDGIIIGYNPAP